MKLVIEIECGIVTAVYTDSNQDIDVFIKDSDDRYDENRVEDFKELEERIKGMRDVLWNYEPDKVLIPQRYLVVSKNEFTRDSQVYAKHVAKGEDSDIFADEDWMDCTGGVVLGVYTAKSETEAIKQASEYYLVHEDNLDTYCVTD